MQKKKKKPYDYMFICQLKNLNKDSDVYSSTNKLSWNET